MGPSILFCSKWFSFSNNKITAFHFVQIDPVRTWTDWWKALKFVICSCVRLFFLVCFTTLFGLTLCGLEQMGGKQPKITAFHFVQIDPVWTWTDWGSDGEKNRPRNVWEFTFNFSVSSKKYFPRGRDENGKKLKRKIENTDGGSCSKKRKLMTERSNGFVFFFVVEVLFSPKSGKNFTFFRVWTCRSETFTSVLWRKK